MLLMSYMQKNDAQRKDVWFLDSRCSNHMFGDKSLFHDLNEIFKQTVKLRNNTKMDVLGKVNVRLKINGFVHVVCEVFLCLN